MDDWLKSLKAGDEVCYTAGGSLSKTYIITKIAKITSAGKIRMDDGRLFNEKGSCRAKYTFEGYYWLQPYTDEIKQAIRHSKLLDRVESFVRCGGLKKLTNEQLEAICGIVGIEEEVFREKE